MRFNHSGIGWPGRKKHPAPDPINALLSLTYTLIMHELTGVLEGLGLDPYLGFLPQMDYGRPSLALDVMEPFRHPIADRFVMTRLNRRMVDADDLRDGGDRPGLFLTPEPMKRFFADWEVWMLSRPAAKDGAARPSFREILHADAEHLARALRGNADFEPFLFDREPVTEESCATSSVTT